MCGFLACRSSIAACGLVGGLLVEAGRGAGSRSRLPAATVTDFGLMISRTSLTSNGSDFSRAMVRVTASPALPRICLTASLTRQAEHALAVDGGDVVAGLDAGLGGGRAVDRRDHLDHAVFAGDLEAQAAVFAAGLVLHVVDSLRGSDSRSAGRARSACRSAPPGSASCRPPGSRTGARRVQHVAEQLQHVIGVGLGRRAWRARLWLT